MSAKIEINHIFDIPDCFGYKRYKVYCIKNFEGKIIYIGCTKVALRQRVCGHISDTFIKGYKKELYNHYIATGKRFTIEILYDFNDKKNAGITERILINFYKTYIDPSMINTKALFNEDYFTNHFLSPKHY